MQQSPKRKFGQAIKLVRAIRQSDAEARKFQASNLADKVWVPVDEGIDDGTYYSIGNPPYLHVAPDCLTEIQIADLRAQGISPDIAPIIGMDTDSTCANVLRYYL